MEKRLFRNEYEKVVGGVCSGIAEYMEVDVTIIRLLFVLSTIFLVGTGILVYLVMWIVVPVNNDPAKRFAKFNEYNKGFANPFEQKSQSQGWTSPSMNADPFRTAREDAEFRPLKRSSETGKTVAGLILLVLGIYFLMNEFNIIPFWFNVINVSKMWPLVFVAIGISFILKAKNRNAWEDWKRQQDTAAPVAEQPAEKPADRPVDSAVEVPVATETPIQEVPKVDDRFTKKDI